MKPLSARTTLGAMLVALAITLGVSLDVSSAPALSPNLAAEHAAAAPGATITVPAGNYGNQDFTLDKPVTFVAQPGAVLGDVTFETSSGHIELRGFQVARVFVGPTALAAGQVLSRRARDIRLVNLDGRSYQINAAERVRVIGGDWGPNIDEPFQRPTIAPSNKWDDLSAHPYDIYVQDGYYHDYTYFKDGSGEHVEGILIYGGIGIVVRGARFDHIGGTGDLYIATLNLPAPIPTIAHVLIENNVGSTQTYTPADDTRTAAYFNVQVDGDVASLDWGKLYNANSWPKGVLEHPGNHPVSSIPPPPNWPPAREDATLPPPAPAYDMNAQYDLLESSTIHKRYVQQNPLEAARVERYWRSGGVRPAVATVYGRFLVNAAEELRR